MACDGIARRRVSNWFLPMRTTSAYKQTQSKFQLRDDCVYIAFNKPYGVLSQFSKPTDSDRTTLLEFDFPAYVYPIGRLDHDSEGLLLLSDDGRLNQFLLHPSHRHTRTYLAQVERTPLPEALRHLQQGVMVKGKETMPALVELLEKDPELTDRPVPIRFRKSVPTRWLKITLVEGRNRQVRRMTASVGHPTLRLVRVAIGSLNLFDLHLAPGEWKRLASSEVLSVLT